ncbi:NACHT, LRR and PYD domains-containing protein 12 [Sorex fumeus]|uniref:NACHT, LRR and PYD domains-containing protein 12 n=1 Tax=Sorex fumeus TaxID=62283 RepID=UPI0024ACD34E|nr:NACHT, LRR and PYD domains-containing protein 12 [Sorex fumeus]
MDQLPRLPCPFSGTPVPCAPARDGLWLLVTYLEELGATELKKFKFCLGPASAQGPRGIAWSCLETAGPLEVAQLLVTHCGEQGAWLRALNIFEQINRKDLWEKGQREELVSDPRETYRDQVRRRFRLMQDRNGRLGECVNLSQRYTRLLLVQEHATPLLAQQTLLGTGRGHVPAAGRQASLICMEALFEPDEARPEPPCTVVLQGAAGMGKSMLAHKVMLDWADGRLFQDRFDYVFYINCRELNQGAAPRSARDLLSELRAPFPELLRAPERLLFIIDGFDELQPALHDARGPPELGWEQKQPPALLLGSLMRKELLPEASLLVTTRPTALEKLQRLLQQPRHVEVLGFSPQEREEYFHKYFLDAEQAGLAFRLVRDNEPLFTLCFVPLVCWVVCTCLKQQLEAGGLLRQTSRTTTAVYLLYFLTLMQPKSGATAAPQPPPNLRGLCSLAASGLWSQKILFEEQDLRQHGLDGADVSSFLNMNIFQKDIDCEKFYSFIHLSFQEFFAAMHYLLAGADALDGAHGACGSSSPVHRLLAEYGLSERSFLALTVHFLFGLLNEDLQGALQRSLGWTASPHGVRAQLLAWIRAKAQSDDGTLQRGSLELFSCLYEIQEDAFIQEALSPFQVVVVSDITTNMQHAVSSFCARSCRNLVVLHLYGAAYGADAQNPQERCPHPERSVLPAAYGEQLAEALSTNPGLLELALYRTALGNQGVRLLCQGVRHPSCRLQNLRLKRCGLPAAACQDLAAALVANNHLLRVDLSSNGLGLAGAKLLCEGLRHPSCRLQMLQLRKCQLEAEACLEVASVLSTSRHLLELDLTGNPLKDSGLQLLCPGLRHPLCRLRILWLKICHLTAAACEDLASVLGASPSLVELDLSLNELGDPGVLLLCEGLKHPQCRLQTLRLGICRLGSEACGGLAAVLQVNPHLREMDLSFNDLGNEGLRLLSDGLTHPTCRIQKLWLDSCGLTAKAGERLFGALATSQTLRELYLTNNALGDSGVRSLCRGLRLSTCKLRVLWLFGMNLSKATHKRLSALRLAKPYLDLGC